MENDKQIDELEMTLTTKSKVWECEKEYRQIFDFKKDYADYPGKLTRIIFGCQAKFDDIEIVMNLENFNKSEIEFSKTFIFPNSYKLGISTAAKLEYGIIRIPETC